MPDRVLVTGASGFIGRHLVAGLAAAAVPVVSHTSTEGDIARCDLPYDGIAHVYHLAARSSVPGSWDQARAYYETNVLGTVNVLELCRRTGASITLLSSYVYGPPRSLPVSEDHPLAAVSPYSHTKVLAEQAGSYYAKQFGVKVGIVRAFNIYGPGQRREFLVPTIIQQALSNSAQIEVADTRPKRDYLYVSDFRDLLLLLRGRDGIYNAGSGSSASVAEVAESVNALLPRPKPVVSRGVERSGEVFEVVADIRKARRDLGWVPKVTLEQGLRATLDAWKSR
jgi:nucleoside-diphosphate-sugar epimerase